MKSLNRVEGNNGIPGSHRLYQQEQKIRQYWRERPEALQEARLMKRTAWNFQIRDPGPIQNQGWWATDIQHDTEYLVPARCRARADNCYIVVEDAIWLNRVNQAAVDSILAAWENRTPAHPTKGIYQTGVETFGAPPDIDNDPKIIILILDIKDGYAGFGSFVAGYFFGLNQYPDNTTINGTARRSNQAEIYYVDANPLNLNSSSGLTLGMQTAAHEFQHMIHFNYDQDELTFVNESLSQVAELVCGYPYLDQSAYTDNTGVYLLGWNSTLADYSRGSRWSLYLWNQFSSDYLKRIVQSPANGIQGYNDAFVGIGTARRFSDVFEDWLIANYLNDASVNSRYAYTYTSSLTKPRATTYDSPNTGTVSASLNSLAAHYYTFHSGSNLNILFSSNSSSLVVRAIKIGPSTKTVDAVPLGQTYAEPNFGSTFTEITFVVMNTQTTQQQAPVQYNFQASGVAPSAPSAPTLVSPNDNEMNVPTNPTLTWNASSTASSYRVQVARDILFSNLTVDRSGIVSTSYQVSGLAGNTTYYWRVSASNVGGSSPFSLSRSFTTVALPSGSPVALRYVDTTAAQGITTVDGALPIDSGFVFGTNMYVDQAKATAFVLPSGLSQAVLSQVKVWFIYKRQGLSDQTYRLQVFSGSATSGPGSLLHSMQFSSNNILADNNLQTREPPTVFTFQQPVVVDSSFFVAIDFGLYGAADYGSIGIGSTGRLGRRVAEEWEKWEDGRWVNVSDAWTNGADGWNMWIEATVLTGTTDVEREVTLLPGSFTLRQNYPNPFNPSTVIRYEIPEKNHVKLEILDALGRVVAVLVDQTQNAGSYKVVWNGETMSGASVTSGVYFYRLVSGNLRSIKKMVFVK